MPFVDANMREVAMTGFMSNRGRQNVASFLTKDLGLDWRMGAEWFEHLLVCIEGLVLNQFISNHLMHFLMIKISLNSRITCFSLFFIYMQR